VYAAKNEGLGEYQQSGFPANLQSKRRRISRSSSEDALSYVGAEVMDLQVFTTDADRTCAAGASTHLPEVTHYFTDGEMSLAPCTSVKAFLPSQYPVLPYCC
jgi:hypothetical protein